MIRVVAHLTSKPETISETRADLESFIQPTRAEPGCIYYELMQNNADPTDFTFVEEWESDETLDAHLESPHILAFKERPAISSRPSRMFDDTLLSSNAE